jgi:hypothetical protein
LEQRVRVAALLAGDADTEFIRSTAFLSRDEMREVTIYPGELVDRLWHDLESGITRTAYLEFRVGDSRTVPEVRSPID